MYFGKNFNMFCTRCRKTAQHVILLLKIAKISALNLDSLTFICSQFISILVSQNSSSEKSELSLKEQKSDGKSLPDLISVFAYQSTYP